jgi:V/A-type H+-transporting ATPase subunit D
MASVKRNRFFLLQLKKRKELIEQGVKVLTSKRDALMKEFHGLITQVADARRKLDEEMKQAARFMMVAEGVEPQASLATAATSARRDILFEVSSRNIWGVRLPEVKFPDVRRDVYGRGSAPLYRNPVVDETAASFENVINAMAESGLVEGRLDKIGGALTSTNRKVNALEQRIAPEIDGNIHEITRFLEEMSREEIFRLKRYKSTISKKRTPANR